MIMRDFWGYIKNEEYSIGCTGQSVYVYDNKLNELARFKDLKYAYLPVFIPCKEQFIVKSTEGRIAVYSLKELRLLKKFKTSEVTYSQDDGCCFSSNGNTFYNIERHVNNCRQRMSIYDTENFELKYRLFEKEDQLDLLCVEYDERKEVCVLLGFMNENNKQKGYAFVAEINEQGLHNITEIEDEKTYTYIEEYKRMEMYGFTKKELALYGYEDASHFCRKVRLYDYLK